MNGSTKVAGETIKTPGSESNVKEIFDKCWELRKSGQDLMIFNQFEEFGNYLWHYEVTGHAMEEVLKQVMGPNDRFRGMASATGSAGTIASGDYLKQIFPDTARSSPAKPCNARPFWKTDLARIASKASATSTCRGSTTPRTPTSSPPLTIMPWSTSRACSTKKTDAPISQKKAFLNPSSPILTCSVSLASRTYFPASRVAKYYEMDENDVMITMLTDSMELYRSRLHEMHQEFGEYSENNAAADFARYLHGQSTDNMLELTYPERRRVHNLKYYTWVEQQGKHLRGNSRSMVSARITGRMSKSKPMKLTS